MKISGLYGKRISGAKEGYVISVETNGERLVLVCADENEREFAVPFDGASFGESIVYFGAECGRENCMPVRLGRAGFDENGTYLGELEEVTIAGGKLKTARIGKKNYPWQLLISGDIILVKGFTKLKQDVIKDGRTLFKRGAAVTREILDQAASEGEYIQTKLKSI